MLKRPFYIIAVLLLSLQIAGCGIIDYFYLPPAEDTAQDLFDAGNDAMRDKDYAAALKYYSQLKDNYPFSPYALEAELSLADCHYLDEEWLQAAEAYKEFEAMHPRHEAIPYVLYNIGMADLNSYPSIDRPTGALEESYSYFARLRESFPGSEYAEKAADPMAQCRRLMAEHELYVGDFFFRTERYGAALLRYNEIIDKFSDVEEIHAHAVEKAKAAFIMRGQAEAEANRRAREGSWHDWFGWL